MMASLSSSSPGKPLRLKDFLRDDPNSDSCGGAGGGFRITTTPGRLPDKTVRYLLAMELGDASAGDRKLTKCRSNKGPLTKLTAVINTVKMLPFSASPSATGCGHSCATPFPKHGGGGGGGGFLSRSFSRKLRRSFWRKRDKVDHRVESSAAVRTIVRVKDIVRLRSFGDERPGMEPPTEKAVPRSPPSPVRSAHSRTTSSSSSGGGCAVAGPWSDTDSAGSDSFSCGSSVCGGELKESSPDEDANNHCASPRSPYMARGVGGDSISKSTSHREPKTKEEEKVGGAKGMVDCPRHFEEEKDQLSPVSVMDFPFEEDDDDDTVGDDVDAARVAASPTAFRRSLADIERTKHQLLQKIREFESLAALVDPVDLESRFESSEEENEADDVAAADGQLLQFQLEVEERALALLRDVKLQGGPPVKMAAADELLVDFFIERLSCPPHDDGGGVRSRMKRRPDRAAEAAEEEEALLRAAEDWIAGRRRGEAAKGWEGEVREMETGGRWRHCHVDEEEAEEIAGDLGDRVLDALVDELLADLL